MALVSIQILAQEAKKQDGTKFTAYKMNLNGKKVDLRFRQDSEKLSLIPMGISRIKVEGLSESKNSFYPKYYATFKEVCAREESNELTVNPETGEIKEK